MSRHDFSRDQLIVAMDHAGALATVEGIENPGRVIDAGADTIGTEEHRIMEKMWGHRQICPTAIRGMHHPLRSRKQRSRLHAERVRR